MNKLEMYFQDYEGRWYGPIKIENDEDKEYLINTHRNYHYKYMVKLTTEKTQSIVESGYLEPTKTRKRR